MEHEVESKHGPERKASPAPSTGTSGSASFHPMLQLQQQAGNRAVQNFLRSAGIRAKLAISQPDDPEERQADEVASTIMRAPAGFPVSTAPCSCGEGSDTCERCTGKQGAANIYRSIAASAFPAPLTRAPRLIRDALRSPGHALDSSTRAFFEPRLGRDLSDVRIHTSPEASASARAIHAHAYTVGPHIAFSPGQYAPHTDSGRHLLAHELTHVVEHQPVQLASDSTVYRDAEGGLWEDVKSVGSNIESAVVSTLGGVAEAAGELATGVVNAGPTALAWIETEAGKAALAAASSLASALGGTVAPSGSGIEITFPNVDIADVEDETFILPLGIPTTTLFEKDFEVGDFIIEAWAGTIIGEPEVTMGIGPVKLQNLKVLLDPTAGTYLGTGQVFVGSALVGSVEKSTSFEVGAAGILPFEVPIPLWASADGGVRTILRLAAEENFVEGVTVAYSGGSFSFHADLDMKLGALAQLDYEAYLRVEIESEEVCSMIWPISSARLGDKAVEIKVPVTLAVGSGGRIAKVGKVTATPIPVGDIQTVLEGDRPPPHCLKFEELVKFLCAKNKLPPEICNMLPDPSSPGGVGPLGGGGLIPGGRGLGPSGGGGGGVLPSGGRPKIFIDPSAYPESAQHAREAIRGGKTVFVTIDRPNAASRRRSSVGSYKSKFDCDGAGNGKPPCTTPGEQYDEYPQALFVENAGQADVKPISAPDNGGSGASIGNQCRPHGDQVGVEIVIAPIP